MDSLIDFENYSKFQSVLSILKITFLKFVNLIKNKWNTNTINIDSIIAHMLLNIIFFKHSNSYCKSNVHIISLFRLIVSNCYDSSLRIVDFSVSRKSACTIYLTAGRCEHLCVFRQMQWRAISHVEYRAFMLFVSPRLKYVHVKTLHIERLKVFYDKYAFNCCFTEHEKKLNWKNQYWNYSILVKSERKFIAWWK